MAVHIKDLLIDSFRGIKSLRLENLNGINLLTGDNNSGKTSVLELLSVLNNPSTFAAWSGCTRPSTRLTSRRMFFEEFYSLFPADDERKRISFSVSMGNGEFNHIALEADIYDTQLSDGEMDDINGIRVTDDVSQVQNQIARCMELRAHVNERQTELGDLYDFQYRIRLDRFRAKESNGIIKAIYVGPFSYASRQSTLRTVLSDRKAYEGLLDVLKEFDPHVTAITAIPPEHSGMVPDFRILSDDRREALPLSAYGYGMKKALMLTANIVDAAGGILLLDEFETAIHTSAMSATFQSLLSSALRMNTQVFMTSHSKEAIEKVLGLNEHIRQNINLYTLYRHKGSNLVRRMTCAEAIEASDYLGIDLR